MAATFGASLLPPGGTPLATIYQGQSGTVYTPWVSVNDNVTTSGLYVTDERDFEALVRQGWSVISVTRG
jgi:hypothetical protein